MLIPEGVEHLENPDVKNTPTPKDMPKFSDKAAAKTFKKLDVKMSKKRDRACKKKKATVVRLMAATSRVGYQSYKNKNLPVPGLFERVEGYAVLGKEAGVQCLDRSAFPK